MSRPRLLDLFCGAGGAAMGYHRAGFDVVGVDIAPQPHYPFEFIWHDAMTTLAALVEDNHKARAFDAIHASPPCQAYSPHVSSRSSQWVPTLGKDEPALIDDVRDLLNKTGRPYVIENVVGARDHMEWPVLVCGTMLKLPIHRHRLFESNRPLGGTSCNYRHSAKSYADTRGWDHRDMTVTGKGRRAGTTERWSEIMGIDWPMTQHELAEAIPPAYTEWIGRQLLASIEAVA